VKGAIILCVGILSLIVVRVLLYAPKVIKIVQSLSTERRDCYVKKMNRLKIRFAFYAVGMAIFTIILGFTNKKDALMETVVLSGVFFFFISRACAAVEEGVKRIISGDKF
jgi:hypothetical protein